MLTNLPEPSVLLAAAAALFVAGTVKGASGLGYTTCALPLLAVVVGLKLAIAIVLLPAAASNVALMWSAGHLRETIQRFSTFYLAMLLGIGLGIMGLAHVSATEAARGLGVITVLYALMSLARVEPRLSPAAATRLQMPAGLANGLVTGLTGSQVLPLVPYMMAQSLDRARFVQAINTAVTLASVAMLVGLTFGGLMTRELVLVSVLGIVPAFAGVSLGNGVRAWLSEAAFKRLVLVVLAAMGLGLTFPPSVWLPAAIVVGEASIR